MIQPQGFTSALSSWHSSLSLSLSPPLPPSLSPSPSLSLRRSSNAFKHQIKCGCVFVLLDNCDYQSTSLHLKDKQWCIPFDSAPFLGREKVWINHWSPLSNEEKISDRQAYLQINHPHCSCVILDHSSAQIVFKYSLVPSGEPISFVLSLVFSCKC